MALSDIIDVVGCSLADSLGTGLRGCDFQFENLEAIALLPAGTTIPASDAYDRDSIRTKQRGGLWIQLSDAYSFEWQTGEDEVETAETTGQEAVTRKGLYKLVVMFRRGLYFQKVLNSLSGDRRWDAILFDEEGNQLHVTTSSGGVKGFSIGRFSVSPIEFKNGTNSSKTSVVMQFTNSSNFNQDLGFIGANDLTFNPDEIDGINQVRLSVPSAPSAGTELVVKAVLDKDGSTFVSGLQPSNFLVGINGATQAPSVATANPVTKSYTLTVPNMNTSDMVTTDLYDGVLPSTVIQVGTAPDDVLYQAKTATTIAVA